MSVFTPTHQDRQHIAEWLREAYRQLGSWPKVASLLSCDDAKFSPALVWRIARDRYNLDTMSPARWARWKAVSAGLKNVRFIAPGGVIGMHVLPPMTIILGMPQLCGCGCGAWFVRVVPNQKYLNAEHRKEYYKQRRRTCNDN